MKKIIMLLIVSSSLSVNAFQLEPRCDTFLNNYKRVISNGSFDLDFFMTVEKGVSLSKKEFFYNSLSSADKIKPISRLYAYCKLDKQSGLNTKLSLAIDRSF